MALGLGLMGLCPRDFWNLTPRELEAALRARRGLAAADAPMARPDLVDLMRRYPDL